MKTVLIIEDNLEIRENTIEILELGGFKVISAGNGKEGIVMAVREKPDIILCDIMMPEVDGYQVIRELKADPATSNIPFIYLTASGEKSEVKLAMDMGANGYVRKPFDVRELMQEINKCFS
ncbi:MAG: response regulator transcription factor [Bacteroidota bacterium]